MHPSSVREKRAVRVLDRRTVFRRNRVHVRRNRVHVRISPMR
jgi:hypothetical protein